MKWINSRPLQATSYKLQAKKGFTILELLVVIALIGSIAAFSFPFFTGFQLSQQFDTSTEEIVQALREAQSRAMAGDGDSSWGVFFDSSNDKFVLFRGATYASRASAYDRETVLVNALSLSNISFNGSGNDMVYTKIDGTTNTYGSFKLSSDDGGSTIVSINAAGVVELE